MKLRYLDEFQTFHTMIIGVIVEYGKEYGTFQVQLPYLKDKENIIADAMLLRSYFGKQHGLLWEPELHDVVLVYLYGKNVRKAIILGSLPPVDGELLKERSNQNFDKILRTKEQLEISLHDEKDKLKVQMKTMKHSFYMDDEKEIVGINNLQMDQGIQLKQKDGELHLQGKQKIILECGKSKLEMHENGTIILEGDGLEMKGNRIVIKGQSDVEIQAQNIKLDAKVKIEGSGKSNVKFSSSGIMEIEGNLIKVGS